MFARSTRWCTAFFSEHYEECLRTVKEGPFVPRCYARMARWQECRDSLYMLPEGLERGLLELICGVGLRNSPAVKIQRAPVELATPAHSSSLLFPEPADDPFTPFVRAAEERDSLHMLTQALMWRCRTNVAKEAWDAVVSDATKALLLDLSACADLAMPSAALIQPERIRNEWSALNLRAYGFLRTNREDLCDQDLALIRHAVEIHDQEYKGSTALMPRSQWTRDPAGQAQLDIRRRSLFKKRIPWPE